MLGKFILAANAGVFNKIKTFLEGLSKDISTTFITIFVIGILICAVGAFAGGEEHQSKFKKGLAFCIVATCIFILADPVISYLQNNL